MVLVSHPYQVDILMVNRIGFIQLESGQLGCQIDDQSRIFREKRGQVPWRARATRPTFEGDGQSALGSRADHDAEGFDVTRDEA